jgi:hypothetical protein
MFPNWIYGTNKGNRIIQENQISQVIIYNRYIKLFEIEIPIIKIK